MASAGYRAAMSNPQQPELRRSAKGQVTQDSWIPDVEETPGGGDDGSPVPEANAPGHHPDEEQDKPDLDRFAEALGTRPPEDAAD